MLDDPPKEVETTQSPHSTPGLVSDVQGWLGDPATAFGWILIGDEDNIPTAKRFDTRENPVVSYRPQLTIDFTPSGPVVPTVSQWGLIVMALLFLISGTLVHTARRHFVNGRHTSALHHS